MTIEADDNLKVIYYHKFADSADMMVGISEVDGKATGKGRLRFYRENTGDPFTDRDRKQWFELKEALGSVEQVIDKCRKSSTMMQELARLAGECSTLLEEPCILRRMDGETTEQFTKRLGEQEWAHTKVVEKKELANQS